MLLVALPPGVAAPVHFFLPLLTSSCRCSTCCSVHAGTIRYGVLFTRSIGDADGHAYLGLTATPEMTTGNLTERDK